MINKNLTSSRNLHFWIHLNSHPDFSFNPFVEYIRFHFPRVYRAKTENSQSKLPFRGLDDQVISVDCDLGVWIINLDWESQFGTKGPFRFGPYTLPWWGWSSIFWFFLVVGIFFNFFLFWFWRRFFFFFIFTFRIFSFIFLFCIFWQFPNSFFCNWIKVIRMLRFLIKIFCPRSPSV